MTTKSSDPRPTRVVLHTPTGSRWLLTLPALVVMATAGFVQSPTFDTSAGLEDYAFLKHALEAHYANLAWFGSPESGVDLPALDRETLAALQGARQDADVRQAILDFVHAFHDGHFSSLRTNPGPETPKPAPSDFVRSDPDGGCAKLGYAPYEASAFSAPFEAAGTFDLLADGVSTPFRAGLLTTGTPATRIGIVRIPEFETTHPSLCRAVWNDADSWFPDGRIQRGSLRNAATLRWYQTLADLLHAFQTQGATSVLIDIGNNSGGDDSGDIATRLFTGREMQSSALWMTQDATVSTGYFDEELTGLGRVRTIDSAATPLVDEQLAVFTAGKAALATSTCALDWVWHERRPWASQTCRRLVAAGGSGGPLLSLAPGTVKDRQVAEELYWPLRVAPLWGAWTGPLYVHTDHRTYSAAEMFAAILQNNHVATFIGEKTGGDGCGFMNATPPVVLPHSGLRFRLPNCVRLRADGTDEVAGVSPDLAVPSAPGPAGASAVVDALVADLRKHGR